MRIFTRCALGAALVAGGLLGSSAAAAHAAISGAGGGAVFESGPIRFNMALDISCASVRLTVAPGTLADPQSVPVTFPVGWEYLGCSTSLGGATAHCRGLTLTATAASAGTASLRVNHPGYAPTPPGSGAGCHFFTSTGCQYRFITSAQVLPMHGNDRGLLPAELTLTRTSVPFTTNGGFVCLGINSGSAFIESAVTNGDVVFGEQPGSSLTFA
jgi:hypothetical protein